MNEPSRVTSVLQLTIVLVGCALVVVGVVAALWAPSLSNSLTVTCGDGNACVASNSTAYVLSSAGRLGAPPVFVAGLVWVMVAVAARRGVTRSFNEGEAEMVKQPRAGIRGPRAGRASIGLVIFGGALTLGSLASIVYVSRPDTINSGLSCSADGCVSSNAYAVNQALMLLAPSGLLAGLIGIALAIVLPVLSRFALARGAADAPGEPMTDAPNTPRASAPWPQTGHDHDPNPDLDPDPRDSATADDALAALLVETPVTGRRARRPDPSIFMRPSPDDT